MHIIATPSLTADEIDDLLYLTRVNEAQELQQTISEFAKQHGCTTADVVEACVDAESGNTMLHYCAANGLSDLLTSVLAYSGVTKSGEATNGKAAARPALINKQNGQGNTPLHWAAYNGHLQVVRTLVELGADMWIKNAAGHLAMFEAERADKSDVVQFLLEAGGREVERTGVEGTTSNEDEAEVQDAVGGAGSADEEAKREVEDVEMKEG